MKRTFILTLVAIIAVVFGTWHPAAAQATPEQAPQVQPRMGCEKNFDRLDANQDGQVTKEEFMAAPHRTRNPERMFNKRDQNGDGTLTKEEFCATRGPGRGMRGGRGCEKNFAKMDANHDGQVTKEEFMAISHRSANPERMFQKRDANGDGALTLDEMCSGPPPGQGRGRAGTQ
ncbi:MAG TPA: EF-hand domain-containing protein [Syntrophobacteraceae bacterium]|nr:EF-hand domain-containing protein [Syntrophobacteraceae bacterium]